MTRFARSKGSKASNERVPEKATSWAEMKQQLLMKTKEIEENNKRQEVHNQRNATYKAFLEEREESESKKTTWADFTGSGKPVKETKKSLKKAASKNNGNFFGIDSSDDEEFAELKSKVDDVLDSMNKSDNTDNEGTVETREKNIINSVVPEKKLKQKKVKKTGDNQGIKSKRKLTEKCNLLNDEILNNKKIDSDSEAPPEEETAKKEITRPVIKVKKPKQKKLKIVVDKESEIKNMEEKKEGTNRTKNKRKLSDDGGSVKKKLKKSDAENERNSKQEGKEDKGKGNQKKKIVKENLTEKDLKKIEKKRQKRLKQLLKKKKIKDELKKQKEMKEKEENMSNGIKKDQISDNKKQFLNDSAINKKGNVTKKTFEKHNFNTKTKKEKIDNKEHSRKKPLLPHKMFMNGKELEIEYVDGFPVKKEDAVRLKKLRREMISKGLPRSEINVALKLERRKAEKAFAREKKKVR